MIILSIITVLMTLCSAKININITTSHLLKKTVVKCTGQDKSLVNDREITLFCITHEDLNRGLKQELGKVPDDIFLRDPTPYENLFKEKKWPEVARVLSIKRAKIVEFIQENVVLNTHVRINNTTGTITSKTDMIVELENTASSFWSENGLPRDYIQCGVNIEFGYGNWSFNKTWRDESTKSVRIPFGATLGIIEVKPGQTVETKLLGVKAVMLIEIVYTAKLVGNIITDYENLHGGHHFYAPTIENIMEAAEVKNNIETIEYLELRFFVDPQMEAYDKDTGQKLNVEQKKIHWRKKVTYPRPSVNKVTTKIMFDLWSILNIIMPFSIFDMIRL